MCMYVYITLQGESDLFDLQWNVHRIRFVHLDFPTGVPDLMVSFWDVLLNHILLTPSIFFDLPSPLFQNFIN